MYIGAVRERLAQQGNGSTSRSCHNIFGPLFSFPRLVCPLERGGAVQIMELKNFGHAGRVLGSSQVGAARLGSACACLPPRSLLCQDITRHSDSTRLNNFGFVPSPHHPHCRQGYLAGEADLSHARLDPFRCSALINRAHYLCLDAARGQCRFRPLRTVLPACRSLADIRHPPHAGQHNHDPESSL